MCVEIEAKLKVESLEKIRRKLNELNAEFLQEQLQTDYHFDDANMTLQKTDRCLRLRRQLANGSERFFLTFKGAKEKSSFKKRQEIEIEITDSSTIQKLLLALGYKKVLVIEKKRWIWRMGDCEVALDQLPLLGDFIEIEGPDEKKIEVVQKNLGLSELPHIKKSYAILITDRLHELGKNQREVYFTNSNL